MFKNIVTVFVVPLLGNTNPSDCAKKRQQAFLAPLLGMNLKTQYLVIAFRNANNDLWRRADAVKLMLQMYMVKHGFQAPGVF